MPARAPDSPNALPDADAQGLKTTAAELDRFSRRIDFLLWRHCATRALWQGVRTAQMRHDAPMSPSWMPSPWTLLFAIAGLALVLPLVDLDRMPLGAWPWALVGVLTLVFELWLLPRMQLSHYRFALMRLEARSDAEYGDTYIAARSKDTATGFGSQAWRPVHGVEVGDLVMAVSDRRGRGLAVVPLRLEGRLPLATWLPDRYRELALPALSEAVQAFARDFDRACDRYATSARKIERSRALRSARYMPRARDPEAAWADLALPPDTLAQLRALAAAFAAGAPSASRGLLLHGPSGTGKTLIARALAESIDCAFYPLSLPDLKSGYIGQSGEKVNALWHAALAQPRAVIFVDECDGVFGRRGGSGTDAFADDIVSSFIARWDGFSGQNTVWVIGATNRRELIDPAVLSRFEDQAEIGLPDAVRRAEILGRHLQRHGLSPQLPERAAEMTAGLSGRDLAGVAKSMARTVVRDGDASPRIDDASLEAATRQLRKRGGDEVAAANWDRLILPDAALRELQAVAGMLKHADALQRRGISVPRGMLLYGPPGTGKTLAARTLAHETGLRFIAASTADIKQGYVGQSGQKVRELFERAREAAPSLLFVDEIDIVAGVRGGQDSFVDEIVGQLLQEMDGAKLQARHVFVLAATNRIDQVDPAVLSRLPRRIEIPLPDAEGLVGLLRALLIGKPLDFELEAGVRLLAGYAAGASGRDLRSWTELAEQRAVMRALADGDPKSVAIALEDFRD